MVGEAFNSIRIDPGEGRCAGDFALGCNRNARSAETPLGANREPTETCRAGDRRSHLAACCLWLLLGTLAGCGADANTAPKEKWYDVQGVGDAIYEQKMEVLLPAETALKMFTKEFPHFKSTWKAELKRPIKPAPTAWPVPAHEFVHFSEEDRKPRAVVTHFSEKQIVVMLQKPIGYYLWHGYSECLGVFRIDRNSQVDELFGMTNFVQQYATPYKGVGYGSSQQAVIKALGQPDASESYQAAGYFRFWYFKDDIVIQFQNSRVKTIQRGVPVPADLKEEVKPGGIHKTRA